MLNNMQALLDFSALNGVNQTFVESLFEQYVHDKNSVSADWQALFATMQYDKNVESNFKVKKSFENFTHHQASGSVQLPQQVNTRSAQDLINAYRRFGYLVAQINPLKFLQKKNHQVAQLELATYQLETIAVNQKLAVTDFQGQSSIALEALLPILQQCYTSDLAVEYMHLLDESELAFIRNKIESEYYNLTYSTDDKKNILQILNAAESLEKYLAAKYPGAKRFGLEGCDSLLVALDAILTKASSLSVKEITLGMSHRGRLNVLVNILGKLPNELFNEFEGKHDEHGLESGDVKYHQGFSSNVKTPHGDLHLSLMFNPSHLEIVTPVVIGSVRARQQRRQHNQAEVLAVNVHGDAAFAGQGVIMEILNMAQCPGFKVGGTIHIIANNQIGFTTDKPEDARSTMHCSDIGKMLNLPIIHVNADCPEAVAFAANMAVEYRALFKKDIIIDMIGYRRLGHNEADEPAATQPLMYAFIKQHPSVLTLYQQSLIKDNILTSAQIDEIKEGYRTLLDKRDKAVAKYITNLTTDPLIDWQMYSTKDWRASFNSQLPLEVLQQLAYTRDKLPANFKLHARVEKIVADRLQMTKGEILADWGYCETLAYATLLNEGYNIRLSGQDCGRGTFFHRHAVWHEQDSGNEYLSLNYLHAKQGKFDIINSILSEEAVLGFEYGFSTTDPRTLVIWEAQFGDFANGAQVVIDQFISSGEQKWGRLSGLVMLLPHGYEGQGPEHSSARLERYLQLCAQNNIQVCVPSNPAQIYHLLRRQLLRSLRKPLIVITPKSLLRHKKAVSTLADLSNGDFQLIIDDHEVNKEVVTRLVMCSGKIYYELLEHREKAQVTDLAIIRIEQLYPFPGEELTAIVKEYPKLTTLVWCQEEPENQGAWYSSRHFFEKCISDKQTLSYAGRSASAAPAVGYASLHQQQQEQLLIDAIGKKV
jgi:2-oxoglutarate dehydrogenase E1 component